MSLITKHRPEEFDSVFENEDTVKSLKKILKRKRADIPNAFLFTGPSGCGKTTFGRIVANSLGCTGTDLVEMDSADFRGIDSVRSIKSQMMLKPMGDCRVWIIDECHKMTNDAQNALLKALEEPPGHVFFILCTTDPDKLIKTIVNRCTQFQVEAIPTIKIVKLIQSIADEEEASVPRDVVKQIARDSLGSPRAAISILDKIIDLDEDEMLAAAEQTAQKENQVIELSQALMKNDKWENIVKILKGLEKQDPESVRRAVIGYCASIMKTGKQKDQAYLVVDAFASRPTYDIGVHALVLASYEALEN
jgi:DNA polymerase-3 subunit gamma/tau